jgi:hypothetical protein
MPPKAKRAKAVTGKDAQSTEIDSKLAAVDLLVAEMRSQLEAACVGPSRTSPSRTPPFNVPTPPPPSLLPQR